MRKNQPRQTYYCSFCDKTQEQVKRLIAGPHGVFVCDECATALSAAEHTPQTDNKLRCSFCGKNATQVQYLSRSGSQGTRICSECVNLCLEIIAEENNYPPPIRRRVALSGSFSAKYGSFILSYVIINQ